MLLDVLMPLKDFLEDRPSWAILSLSLVCNGFLFNRLMRAKNEHLATVIRWMPLVDTLSKMVSDGAAKVREDTREALR